MFDYRLFYPQISLDDDARLRRVGQGAGTRRVYQLPPVRRSGRNGGRR